MLRFLAVACLCAQAFFASPVLAGTPDDPGVTPPVAAQSSTTTDGNGSPAIAGKPAEAVAPSSSAAPAISEPAQAAASADDKAAVKKAEPPPPPAITLTAAVDLSKQTIVVSENGEAKYTWPISSGTQEHPTPRGTFHPEWIAKIWYSRQYDNAPMPNAVFINGGVAIHATPYTRYLGTPASHGCIRLSPTNAKTFYALVQKHGLKSTKVSVFGSPKWRAPAVASRSDERRYAAGGYSGRGYQALSAYDPNFIERDYRSPRPKYFTYPGDPPPRVYRRYRDERALNVQRGQRRVYYYNSYSSGW